MTYKRKKRDTLKAAALGLHGRGKRFFCPACQPHEGKTQDLFIGDNGFICHKCRPKGDLLKLIDKAVGILKAGGSRGVSLILIENRRDQ